MRLPGWDSRGVGSLSLSPKGRERCQARRPLRFTWTLCNWCRRPGVRGAAVPARPRARSAHYEARRPELPADPSALVVTEVTPERPRAPLGCAGVLEFRTPGFPPRPNALDAGLSERLSPSPSGDPSGNLFEMWTRPGIHPSVEVALCV